MGEIENYLRRVDIIKSTVLSLTTASEHLIETILSEYYVFTEEEGKDFAKIFFYRNLKTSLYDKILMLERFIDSKFPQFKKENPEIINQLNRMRNLRNKIAHSMAPKPDEQKELMVKDTIRLIYVEEGILKNAEYTFKVMQARSDDVVAINKTLKALFILVAEDKLKRLQGYAKKILK